MEALNYNRVQTIGSLVIFWHDTQERNVWRETKERLMKFLPCSNDFKETMFNALVENEYIVPVANEANLFEVRGNKKHIKANTVLLRSRSEAGRAGGLKSGKSRSKTTTYDRSKTKQNEAHDEANDIAANLNTIQSNAIQYKAVQSSSKQSNTKQELENKHKPISEKPPEPIPEPIPEKPELFPENLSGESPSRVTSVNPRGVLQEFKSNPLIETMLLVRKVSEETQRAWLEAYPGADWICDELLKANVWIKSNPRKNPKQFSRFMSNWLNRAFESYRKNIPSRRMTSSEINMQAIGELWQRNQEGEL
jgi:hypothetical protein